MVMGVVGRVGWGTVVVMQVTDPPGSVTLTVVEMGAVTLGYSVVPLRTGGGGR